VAERRGMGRGLAAILATGADRPGGEELRRVPLELIDVNPAQPRRRFDPEALEALAASLRARGILQPVLVRPVAGGHYELIAGERRWRAARMAGLEEIPAIVRNGQDAETLELALIENMAREDLNPVEEARACAALVEELGLTHEEVARRVGRGRVAVSNLIRLLDLPDEALALLEEGLLAEGHGRAVLGAADHGDRRRLAREAAAETLTVRELEARVRALSGPPSGEARTRARRAVSHPELDQAAAGVADALEGALGTEVRVRASGRGLRVEIHFESVEQARSLAERLRLGGEGH